SEKAAHRESSGSDDRGLWHSGREAMRGKGGAFLMLAVARRLEELNKCPAGGAEAFAAAQEDAGVNRADLLTEAADADAPAARHRATRHQRDDRHAESRLDHAHRDFRVRRLHVYSWRQAEAVEGVDDVLPAGAPALEEDERNVRQVAKRQPRLAKERMARRGDQAPVEREEVAIFEVGR